MDVGTFLEMKGELALFFGSFTGTKDVSRSRIAKVTSADGGKTWSEPTVLFEDPEISLLHPALVRMANGEIGLAYSKLWTGNRAVKVFRYSGDEGRSWSGEIPLSDASIPYMTGPSDRLYRLSNNRLVNLVHGKITNEGGSKEASGKSKLGTDAFVSDDNGRHWRKANGKPLVVEERPFSNAHEWGYWEPGMVEYAPGKLLMMGRTATGWAYESRSADFGTTWKDLVRSNSVRNPEAPVYLTMIPGTSDILLLYNPIVDPADSWHLGKRTVLAALISSDQGRTWHGYREIAWSKDGEWLCYPCARWVGDTLHIAYHYWTGYGTTQFAIDARYRQISKRQLER
jgi:predicted neuraminidase